MDEKVLKEEQKHLSEVYQQLLMMKVGLEERSMKLDQAASEEKNDIRDNLRFDTADDEVKTEMYAEIETWNRYIDSYNVQSGVLRDKLKKVGLLLDSPYFARVTLQFEPDEEPESYYIGRAAVSERWDNSDRHRLALADCGDVLQSGQRKNVLHGGWTPD